MARIEDNVKLRFAFNQVAFQGNQIISFFNGHMTAVYGSVRCLRVLLHRIMQRWTNFTFTV